MEEKLEQAYLYDFYGELLNEHQRQVYEDFVFNDLSLGEIASEEGISRQGVADLIKRCNKKLLDYEAKLHLVEKFMSIKSDIQHQCRCRHDSVACDFCKIRHMMDFQISCENVDNID